MMSTSFTKYSLNPGLQEDLYTTPEGLVTGENGKMRLILVAPPVRGALLLGRAAEREDTRIVAWIHDDLLLPRLGVAPKADRAALLCSSTGGPQGRSRAFRHSDAGQGQDRSSRVLGQHRGISRGPSSRYLGAIHK